ELFQRDTLISSAARLDFIAEDIVRHFMNRGYRGKAMVVSIDKITAVRTYNRVRQAWLRYQAELERQRQLESDPERRMALEQELQYMQTTDMAVVISASDASEEGKVAQFNREHPTEQLDIRPHHERYEREPLDKHFKDPDNSLRIVFVCFMWMTCFDVPCLSTLYLDHPMEDHTLMQALARPNRVFGEEKAYGQIVDYVGIYYKLLKALNTYAQPDQGITEADVRMPLSEKSELIGELEQALTDLDTFCQRNDVNLSTALAALEAAHTGAEREAQIQAAANALIIREDVKLNFLSLVWDAYRLYQALLPDKEAARFKARIFFLRAVQQTIFAAMSGQNIDDTLTRGRRIIAEGTSIYDYVSRQTSHDPDALLGTFDLSQIDFDALAASMRAENIYLQAERLRSLLTLRLQRMIRVNPKRADYLKKLEDITTKYNRESANNADYPTEIIEFARQVRDEELRPAREQMSEEELAIADLLLSPELHLTVAERRQVKETARTLLKTIQGSNLLVRDWHKKPMMKAGMKRIIGETLDQHLPASYVPAIYESLCQEIFIYILTRYRDYPDGSTMISA
ncbi:MAG: type I restriction endonuclease subunit R, partial [Ktedonobacteraceae bacterium]|nr:type I restriction endonuclease subunit R [Ktedonobacteraceae bacterium]